jgi:autotransporter-associated beta strand protein
VIGSDCRFWPDDYGSVRKEGDGTVRISSFYPAGKPRRTLEIAEGQVIPMMDDALAFTDVRVTGAGTLTLSNYTSQVALGSLQSETGAAIPLEGNELRLGATRSDILSDAVSGTGRVTAVVKNLYVTNIAENIAYGARAGRLRLDSKTPAAVPFAKYDFEESLTKDSSGHGRDLVANGTVERVYDTERDSWVARFTGTANSGGELVATVTDTTELTGDSDYTISLWARTFDTPVANGYPTMVAIGSQCADHSVVQFRFVNNACNTLLLGHWNQAGDWNNLPGPSDPTQWHHYMAMREGCRLTVWMDGVKVLDERSIVLEMTLPETVQIFIGRLPEWSRFFCGDIDDVRIYSRALGPTGIEQLLAGKEPISDGDLVGTAGEPVAIPANTRLYTELNGEIQLAGTQTLARVDGNAVRGGIVMNAGGELAMTGPGTYNAGVRGESVFAKTGPNVLTLGGALTHTGGTEVREGTLVLQNTAVLPQPFAVYDFEDDNLGVDATCNGYTLTTQSGVSREYDAERGGWVARFPGTSVQRLEATVKSPYLTGDTDYTISVWVKPDADCGDPGTFVSLGYQGGFQEIVFRYNGISAGTLCLSHWGGTLDFANVTSPPNPQGAWHHYVAVRKGSVFTVYCDGVQTWWTDVAQALAIPLLKQVCIGRQLNRTDRQFKGLIDDVRVYTEALDAVDVARLYARRDLMALARGAGRRRARKPLRPCCTMRSRMRPTSARTPSARTTLSNAATARSRSSTRPSAVRRSSSMLTTSPICVAKVSRRQSRQTASRLRCRSGYRPIRRTSSPNRAITCTTPLSSVGAVPWTKRSTTCSATGTIRTTELGVCDAAYASRAAACSISTPAARSPASTTATRLSAGTISPQRTIPRRACGTSWTGSTWTASHRVVRS